MKQFASILLLFFSACAYGQGRIFMGDTSQIITYRGQIGSSYGIINTVHDTASIPLVKRTAGLTVITNNVPYTWTGFSWVCGLIPSYKLGIANGVCTLGPDGFVPFELLPFSDPLDFHGFWNASTNTPHLADGVGQKGDMYIVGTAGTQNLGHGSFDYIAGDIIIADPDAVYLSAGRVSTPQVNSDWNAVSGVAAILNKPNTLGGYGITDAVPSNRVFTINGVPYVFNADRSISVGTVTSVVVAGYMNSTGTYTNTVTISPDTATGKLATKTDLNGYVTWPSFTVVTGTTYTLQASDRGKQIICKSNSATTITVPSGLGSTFYCTISQRGTGQVTASAGSGVSIFNADSFTKSLKQGSKFSLLFTDVADTYETQGQMQ